MNTNSKVLCLAAGIMLLSCGSLFASNGNQYFGAGDGTAESPYWVETAEHFNNVKLFPNAHFMQTTDIDLGNDVFYPIGDFEKPFTGKYNGEGHRITVNELGATAGNVKLAGLWGFISNAEIKNLNVEVYSSLKLDGRVCIGGISACSNNSKIKGCNISSDSKLEVTSDKCLYAGGIVGYSAFGTSVKSCSFDGRIEGRSNGGLDAVCAIGGIVGENRTGSIVKKSTLSESASVSAMSTVAPAWVGGIAGFNEDSTYVCDCHAVIPMELKPDYGNLKRVFTNINKCNSSGTVSGYSSERIAVGGIAGFNVGDITCCLTQASANAKGSIIKCNDAPSALIGGIVGDNVGVVDNTASLAGIRMLSDGFLGVGGIAGRNSGQLTRNNFFAVSGKGLNSFTALRSFNLFAALGSVSVRGGIAGINDNTVKKAVINDCRVFGINNDKTISSFGHTRSNYGETVGLEIK